MNTKYTITGVPGAPPAPTAIREYFVQAEEIVWDYAPTCIDAACSNIAKVGE